MPNTDKTAIIFTLAKRAAWAGDVEYCHERLTELKELIPRRVARDRWEPLALIRQAGKRIEAHLEGKAAPPRELMIETAHLRGVVWQVDRREFELLAYLIDYSWEKALGRHAKKAAAAEHVTILGPEEEDDIPDKRELKQLNFFPQEEHAPAVDEGMGLSWEEDAAGLQCVVTVGDLGLIKIRGLWVGRDMPQNAEEVVSRFRGILDRIESPDGANVASRNSGAGNRLT